MRKTLLLLAALAAGAYVAGQRAQRPSADGKHYTPYQRAALLWTSPRVVGLRRAWRKRTR